MLLGAGLRMTLKRGFSGVLVGALMLLPANNIPNPYLPPGSGIIRPETRMNTSPKTAESGIRGVRETGVILLPTPLHSAEQSGLQDE